MISTEVRRQHHYFNFGVIFLLFAIELTSGKFVFDAET